MARPSKHPVHPKDMVLAVLKSQRRPMSAYDVLGMLEGVKGPVVVYRALDALMKEGTVHKIKALNSFIACDCRAGHKHKLSVLTVCNGCKNVDELHDHGIIHQLESLREHGVAIAEQAVIELPVTCGRCAA